MTTSIEQHRPAIEAALRVLDSHAFDTKALWRELSTRIAVHERGTPGEADLKYTCPTVAPDITTHFVDGEPQVLDAGCMWGGYSYSLTPGQRSVLRDTYGMTPTQTVTVEWVELWPGTQHPRTMKLKSDIHIDPRNRKHVLTSCVIRDVAAFFTTALRLDNAEDASKTKRNLVDETLTLDKVYALASEDVWAIEDLTGVRVSKTVELTNLSADRFVVVCMKTGNVAKVPRKEFFTTVAEYERLYADTKVKRASKAQREQQSLENMLKSLGL